MIVKIVARSEGDVPTIRDLEVARCVERLREGVGIAHGAHVDLTASVFRHGDAVGERQRPRHGEGEIAVSVQCGFFLFLFSALSSLNEVRIDVCIFQRGLGVIVGVVRLGGVCFLLSPEEVEEF